MGFACTRFAFEADQERDRELKLLGYDVVRFTWRQLTDDPAAVGVAVRKLLRSSIRIMDPERARKRLAGERARIERELERLGQPEASDEPLDTGDQANELEQTDTDNALREDLRRTLEAIDRAEARLEDGKYGVSVVSGEPIPDQRLEAIPWADRKVDE